jgi:hypothetical protein
MTVTDEEIAAFVDGELDAGAQAAIVAAMAHDAALGERIAAERTLRAHLCDHFAPIADEPVPDAWIAQIRAATAPPPAPVIDLAHVRAERARGTGWPGRFGRTRPWAGAAIAASLVIGVAIGAGLHRPAPIVAGDGALVASGPLAQALDSRLASAGDGDGTRILGTFRRQGGNLCRVFVAPVASGIACRDGGTWQMQRLRPGESAPTGAYRQAGSSQADLMAEAQAMASGDPLDAAQERAARARDWH